MKVSVKAAETNLSELIDTALAGEEVFIYKDSQTSVKIVAVHRAKQFKFGLLEGKLGTSPDFLEPMSEEDLAACEGRGLKAQTTHFRG